MFTRILIVVLALAVAACSSTGAAHDVAPYPLETCIVTDNELGTMGDPITKVYDGREIKFCCKPCVKEFEADPATFLAKLAKLTQ